MDLLAYTRVSTLKQLEGEGLAIQKNAIEQYCKAMGHTIKKLYTDKGISAIKNRPAFNKMLVDVDEAEGVIVHDLTRFGRSTLDLLQRINQLNDRGKAFISVRESIDITSKTGKLLLTVLSAIADFERETIQDRFNSGKEYALEHGTKSGKPMHRPLLDIDWVTVDMWKKRNLSLSAISKIIGVSKTTLYARDKLRQKG
jgi:DNA invertase Pin-like site-specific DNA recombinase